MFTLAIIKDVIRVPPADFSKDFQETLTVELNAKYANKVLSQVGLCIILYDILNFGDQYIYPSDGAAFVEVEFRYVIFRPFIGEVVVGKVRNCNASGIQVSMGFFDDIFIPTDGMPHPNKFDREDQIWYWTYSGHSLPIEPGADIRFRVLRFFTYIRTIPSFLLPPRMIIIWANSETFQDVAPPSTSVQPHPSAVLSNPAAAKPTQTAEVKKINLDSSEFFKQSPFTITASINDDGLGPLEWWQADETEYDDSEQ